MTPALPFVSVGDATVSEGSAGTKTVTVYVTLSRASDVPVTVAYATVDGSAVAGSDYTAASGTVTFAPGVTSQAISFTVLGDGVQEGDETFTVVLTSPVGALLGDASGVVTILNDDVPSIVGVVATDTSAVEGGLDTGTFVVSRDGDLTAPLSISLIWGGAADRGVDYTVSVIGGTLNASASTLTLAAGVGSATITVTALTDTDAEPAESVVLTIGPSAAYGVGSDGSATVLIQDAGSLPTLTVTGTSVVEGDRGGTWAYVTVTLSAPSTSTVTVELRTFDGAAKAGEDYRSTVETITFAPGETTKTVAIRILSDKKREGNESFTVQLSSPTNAAVLTGVATVTIIDDDGGTLLASSTIPSSTTTNPLTADEVAPLLAAALAEWAAAGADTAALGAIRFEIVDLGGHVLAEVVDGVVLVDLDAAGWGWFVDPTPAGNEEFRRGQHGEWHALVGSGAEYLMDLYSVLLHEIGHLLGYEHTTGPGPMSSVLAPGRRFDAPASTSSHRRSIRRSS